MDFLTSESGTSDKEVNILILTDHFTRNAQVYVTKSQTALVVANTLWEQFLIHCGFPEKIMSDQGNNFESKLISELCHLAQVKKLHTTPYRPESNGACERFNHTLISMIARVVNHWKVDPYRVRSQCGDGLPVFRVQSCGTRSKRKSFTSKYVVSSLL